VGQNFSGSCTVTSRNSLIQKGATTATKSGDLTPKEAAESIVEGLTLRRGVACYSELPRIPLFFSRTRLNKGYVSRRMTPSLITSAY